MKKVDIARLRGYDIQELLKYEIRSTSFCQIKVGILRKSWKSELAQKIKKFLPSTSNQIPISEINSAILIDFLA